MAPLTVLVSSVTAPLRARSRPITPALVFRVMLVNASRFPTNEVAVPRVAEEPICQNTLQGDPLLMTATDALLAVVRVLPILKMKTAPALPCAFRTSAPVSCALEVKQ